MRQPIHHRTHAPSEEELRRGRGVPSGDGGLWRVLQIAPWVSGMTVYYPNFSRSIETLEQWAFLPSEGLQVIARGGSVWKGCDEYIWQGVSKYGVYLDDEIYDEIESRARAEGRVRTDGD